MSTDAYRRAPRRRFDATTKLRILAACDIPGATIAKVAQAHAINVNLLHKWRRTQSAKAASNTRASASNVAPKVTPKVALVAEAAAAFVPLALPPPPVSTTPDIRIELRRGATTMTIAWPGASAAECATWLREWLR